MVYGHANGRDIEETIDEVGRNIDNGYKAIRAQSGVPGIKAVYGVSENKDAYEPAKKGLPLRTPGQLKSISTIFPDFFKN